MGGNYECWTKAETQILKKRYPHEPTINIMETLGKTYGQVARKACRMGLKKSDKYLSTPQSGRTQPGTALGKEYRFKPGCTPHNKGVKGWSPKGDSDKTRFKIGRRPANWKPIGSIRTNPYGYLERKIRDTGRKADWIGLHIQLWTVHHGPVPKGHLVVFKHKRDLRIENLEVIDRSEMMRRNRIGHLPIELQRVILLNGKLKRLIDEKQN